MPKVKIKAPVNSLQSARLQLDAGAQELYIGLDAGGNDLLNFSARATRSFDGTKVSVTDEVLAEVCALAHSRNATVEMTANGLLAVNDPDFGSRAAEQYIDYVRRGIAAGVDGIIVGDLGNLVSLREHGIDIPLTASVHFAAFNRYHIKQLEELGCSSVVLPHHLKTDEIARLAATTPLKLIAFAHMGCSFIETTCTLLHQAGEKINFGIPCRARWTIPATGQKIPITHVAEDCSICRLPMLAKAGVQSLKIIGRELNPQFIASITKTYVKALEEFEQGKTVEEVMANVKSQQPFWNKSYCEPRRCKYMYTLYYV